MWSSIAASFDLEAAEFAGAAVPLESQMKDAAPRWSQMTHQYHLAEPDLSKLVSPWHTDADLGRPIEVVTDMTKSRKLGFLDYQSTLDSFTDLFAQLRSLQLIP